MYSDKLLYGWWIGLLTTFTLVFSQTRDVFTSIYFFLVTASTTGFGKNLPETVLEHVLIVVVIFSSYATLGILAVKIVTIFSNRKVKMDTLEADIDHLIIGSHYDKISVMLESIHESHKVNILVEDTEMYTRILELKQKYSNIESVVLGNVFDATVFNEVLFLSSCCVVANSGSTVTENNYRVMSIVEIIESVFDECRTIGEIKGNPEMLSKVSSGDSLVPVGDGRCLVQELVSPGAFGVEELMYSMMRNTEISNEELMTKLIGDN